LYTDAIQELRKRRIEIQLDAPYRRNRKWGILRALAMRLIHIFFARLDAVARIGSISPFFQDQWDPIILEVFAENKLVGFCSLLRQSAQVFEIEVIGILQTERRSFTMRELLKVVKKYVKGGLGATRIIVSTGSEEMVNLFKNCGFKLAFLDDVLSFDLQKSIRRAPSLRTQKMAVFAER
jgi:hypothetical protein